MNSFFVSGTDTDIGKTFVTRLLLEGLKKHLSVTYFKPIQSGTPTDCDWIKQHSPEVKQMRPSYQFKTPASPDRAAAIENCTVDFDKIKTNWGDRDSTSLHVVEGAGGLLVPINENFLMIDLVRELEVPCLLVASTKLGTINHTLLSVEALKRRGISLLGIVLNGDEDPGLRELLETKTRVPVLFEVPQFSEATTDEVQTWLQSDDDFLGFVDWVVSSKRGKTEDAKLKRLDKENVWHPFTQHGIVKNHPIVSSARGSYLKIEGRNVIDGVSSWWVNLLGHCHHEISTAVADQAHQLEHVLFAGLSHEPAIRLSETLVKLARSRGADLDKAFYSDNGSTAVEVALKMSYQFHQQSGNSQRKRFLALRGSYHGDTLGAMSVGERQGFNEVFSSLMFDVDFVDPFVPEELERAFSENGDLYAAIIFEPMVQGASGMRMYGAEVLNRIESLCREYSVLKVCDEVFTGFYRTGTCFAFEHSELKPDFLCLSKGLTGGYLPLAVTLTSDSMYQAFQHSDMRKAFLHGHSYTANPMACAAANKTLEVLAREETQMKIQDICQWTKKFVDELCTFGQFYRGRTLGTIGALQVSDENPNYFKGDFSNEFNQRALQKGVLLRPLGGTIYSVPPYCVTDQELEKIYETMISVMKELEL